MKPYPILWFFFPLFVVLSGCTKDPEVVAIEGIVESVRLNLEKKDFEGALSFVSNNYNDNVGGRHDTLVPRMDSAFRAYDRLEVTFRFDKPEIEGIQAKVAVRAKIAGVRGSQKEQLFGSNFIPRKLRIYFEKTDGKWMISACELERGKLF